MSSTPYQTTNEVVQSSANFDTLAAYAGGTYGLSSAAEMEALVLQVQALTAALVAKGLIFTV